MRTATLQRVDRNPDPEAVHAYAMDLTVLSADSMPTEVFVKQRVSTNPVSDQFAAIASVAQLEDLSANEPNGESSYFRSASVSFVVINPARLNEIFDAVAEELQQLISNLNALDHVATPSRSYQITESAVTVL